jgi:nucleotide sugar dehydrogenase
MNESIKDNNFPTIGIIGSGVVGISTGLGFGELGHNVIFYDISDTKINELKNLNLKVANNLNELITTTDISFVCVNTPTINGMQDLTQIFSVAFSIAEALSNMNNYHLVVFRSTILPGTMKKIVKNIENYCKKERGKDYDVCYNPEFVREKTSLEDFRKPDRVVIGEDRERVSYPLQIIYQNFTENIITTTFETAEMIKYVSNCFLALKISFFNEIGLLCNNLGIDDKIVSHAVSLDKRIGEYGSIFGKPFGGTCLPKDTEAFISLINSFGGKSGILQGMLDVNEKISKLNADALNRQKTISP